MSILLVCVVVSGAKFSVKKVLSALREWVFSPATGPQQNKERLEKRWQYWENHSPDLLNTLSVEGPVTSKKVNRRQPIQTKNLRSAHSSQSSHTGYYEHYCFSYIPPVTINVSKYLN